MKLLLDSVVGALKSLKTLKKNRNGPWTRGLAITNKTNDLRFCFFEIDKPQSGYFFRILGIYQQFGLDVCTHRTGNGLHFISPTLVSKEAWKAFHKELKSINPKCPMTTLRIESNKYPNEAEIWFCGQWHNFALGGRCSIELLNLLRTWFHLFCSTPAIPEHTDLKFVRYPLP